jgi:hypothetical protein
MSFMVIECPWCGETYTFGIVGTQRIGSGHSCGALVDCIEEGCDQAGRALVQLRHLNAPAEQIIVCDEHINGHVILGWQPGNHA